MTIAAFVAVMGGLKPCTLSGTLDATAVAGVSTSSTRTVTVPSGNTGELRFENYVDTGTITSSQTSKNGGAFTGAIDPTTITFANGDTIAFRCNGNGAGESRVFRVIDVTTGRQVGSYTHTGA